MGSSEITLGIWSFSLGFHGFDMTGTVARLEGMDMEMDLAHKWGSTGPTKFIPFEIPMTAPLKSKINPPSGPEDLDLSHIFTSQVAMVSHERPSNWPTLGQPKKKLQASVNSLRSCQGTLRRVQNLEPFCVPLDTRASARGTPTNASAWSKKHGPQSMCQHDRNSNRC